MSLSLWTTADRIAWFSNRPGQPRASAVEPPLAYSSELLAALPQLQRLLERSAARFQPADHLGEFCPGLFVPDYLILLGWLFGWHATSPPQ
jgi:hypothetical protein